MNRSFHRYAVLSTLVLLSGCANTRVGSAAHTVNDARRLSGDEWTHFGTQLVTEMNETGVFHRYYGQKGNQPVVVGMADWHTKGEGMSHTDLTRSRLVMYSAVRSALVNGTGGMVVVNMDVVGDRADRSDVDSLLQNVRDGQRGSQEYDPTSTVGFQQMKGIDLGMTGMIVPITVKEGRVTKTDYAVTVRLLDVRSGFTVFEKQFSLAKSFNPGWFGL